MRLAYNVMPQKPKGEKADFLNWAKTSKYKQGDDYFRHNGGGELLVFSAADFEDFRQPRPEMPREMEPDLDEVVRILATNRWPWRMRDLRRSSSRARSVMFERVNQDIPLDGLNWFFDHAETISDTVANRSHCGSAAASPCSTVWRIQGEYFVERYGAECSTKQLHRSSGCWRQHQSVGAGTDATRVSSLQSLGRAGMAGDRQDRRRISALSATQLSRRARRRYACGPIKQRLVLVRSRKQAAGRIQVGQFADPGSPDR